MTLSDFEPSLRFDAELPLDQVTPELFQTLCRLEPFGIGNPEPVFTADAVRLMAPPRIMKDKHVKLKLAAAPTGSESSWRNAITFDALGWHMAERVQQAKLIAGDILDIAYSIGQNDHPEYGGLELSLRDVRCTIRSATDVVHSGNVESASRLC